MAQPARGDQQHGFVEQSASRSGLPSARHLRRRLERLLGRIDLFLENGIIDELGPDASIARVLREYDEEYRIEKFQQADSIAEYISGRLKGKDINFGGDEDLQLAELVFQQLVGSDWILANHQAVEELQRRYKAFTKGEKRQGSNEGIAGQPTSVLLEQIFDQKIENFAAFINRELVANRFEDVLPLPRTAPVAWSDRAQGETPPDFIRRIYGEWEGKGLTKSLLRRLDPGLYRALYNWTARGNEFPSDFDLPTLREQNDRMVSDVVLGREPPASAIIKEGRRIESAVRRRTQQK